MVFFLDLFPAGDVVIDKGLVVAELRAVKHGRLGNAPDLLGDIRKRFAVDDVLLFGKEPGMAFAVIRRCILEPLFAQGLAELPHQVPFRTFVDGVPRRQVRIPVGPAVMVLGGEHHVTGTDLLEQACPCRRVPVLRGEFRDDILVPEFRGVGAPAFFQVRVVV